MPLSLSGSVSGNWQMGTVTEIPCRYKPGILVNFYGTFLTTGELPVDYPEWTEGIIDSDGEWGFTGERSLSFEEMVRNEAERMEKMK